MEDDLNGIDLKEFFDDDISNEIEEVDLLGSDLPDDFFEDDINSKSSTSTGAICEQVAKGVIVSSSILNDATPELAVDKNCVRKVACVKPTRFKETVADETLEDYSKGFIPQNTAVNTSWAVRNFDDWRAWRNGKDDPAEHVPEDILTKGLPSELNRFLSLYILETRNKKGERYPSKTITLLLAGIKRHMMANNPYAVNILDENSPDFVGLRGVRDRLARELRNEGVGAEVKHAEAISYEEEELLWKEEVLGYHSPSSLLNTVFFYNGKVLMLRGGREHRLLKLSQFSFGSEPGPDGKSLLEYVKYVENGSKNRSGSYKDTQENKVVKQYADPKLGDRCYYYVLKFYFSKLPKDFNGDSFYLRPFSKAPKSLQGVWFMRVTIGRNTLNNMVSKMFSSVGILGKTNHSLRVTGATRLFTSQVPEKIVQQRSGHRSLDALRKYERTSIEQDCTVSSILSASKPVDYSDAIDCDTTASDDENVKVSGEEVDTIPCAPSSSENPKSSKKSPETFMPYFTKCNNCSINITFN